MGQRRDNGEEYIENRRKGENIFHSVGALLSRVDDDVLHSSAEKYFYELEKCTSEVEKKSADNTKVGSRYEQGWVEGMT
jgi:hypothetical protein